MNAAESPTRPDTVSPFVSVAELDRMRAPAAADGEASASPRVVVVDSRWYLDGRSGADAYAQGHLPGAVFVDLDTVLAAPPSAAAGRHPLPEPEVFARGLDAVGIGDADTVVVYDDAGGVIAARLVWMLRVLGQSAAVLDGGLAAWQAAHPEQPLESGAGALPPAAASPSTAARAGEGAGGVSPASRTARPWPAAALATIDETETAAADGTSLVLDARTADRYRGETEPVDARPGHVPGARSLSCRDNVAADGTLLPVATLRERLTALGADRQPVISYCGSGVTACHTLLVLEQVGLPAGRLYPGSWSQYAADPQRPAATGE
jgi:thiosulfate/3-mercaptopyruvate sulfurtransferase